jgi:hypothetical protein
MEASIRNLRLLEDIFHGIEAFLGDVRFFQRIRGFLKIFYVKWSFFSLMWNSFLNTFSKKWRLF